VAWSRYIIDKIFVIFLIALLGGFEPHSVALGADKAEVLRYEVTWNGQKAGHGDITTKKEGTHVRVIAQAVSDGVLKALVDIWSRVQATFTAGTFEPVMYQYHLKSNRLRGELVDLNFDHKTKTVQINKLLGSERECHSEKFAGLCDPITAAYLLRHRTDLNKPTSIDVFDGRDKSRLFVSPAGYEVLQTKAGRHQAMCLALKLVKLGGDQREIGTAKLWISNDQHRIPLLLVSSPLVGSIRFELVQAHL
jgi:hypothetical protein